MDGKGFYERPGVPQVEIERLEKIGFPNRISESILVNYNLADQKFLDVGAGANPELGRFVSEKGGTYVPLDLRDEMLRRLRGNMQSETFLGVAGKVQELPLANQSVDYSHQRFVLMHLPPADRPKAIQELLRVTKKRILLLEWNWRTMASTTDSDVVERFKLLNFELMEKMNVDPYMGERLPELVRQVDPNLTVNFSSRIEGEGDHTNELVGLCSTGSEMAASRLGDGTLANKFADMEIELSRKSIQFIRPEIGVAEIKLNH